MNKFLPDLFLIQFEGEHQEIIFPVSLVDPINEIAMEWHLIKLGNTNLENSTGFSQSR